MLTLIMKNLIIVLILSSLLFFSCEKSNLEKKITQKNSIWYIFDYDSISNSYKNKNYGYIFKSNGKCDYVYYNYSENKIYSYLRAMSYDIMIYNNWKYDDKRKRINIMCYDYEVVRLIKDTIFLKYTNGSYKIFVNLSLKNPNTLPRMGSIPEMLIKNKRIDNR